MRRGELPRSCRILRIIMRTTKYVYLPSALLKITPSYLQGAVLLVAVVKKQAKRLKRYAIALKKRFSKFWYTGCTPQQKCAMLSLSIFEY